MEKLRSLLSDRRLPIYFHYNLLNRILTKRRIKKNDVKELTVSFTFDIEKDRLNDHIKPLSTFFNMFNKFLESKKIESTLFVQANLIKEYSTQLNEFQKTHELGLHGYGHELWGYEQWWIRKKSLSLKQKRKLILRSLEIFERNNLERPTSFRAPNLIINKKTLTLIKTLGFRIDSSFPSFLGVKPIPRFFDGLLMIPHTANPIPKFEMRFCMIPFVYYEIFTLPYVISMDVNEFLEFVGVVISYQNSFGVKPHLVFLAHSWEFKDYNDKKVNRNPQVNYKSLLTICNKLESNYKVDYVTINNLAKKLELID